MGTAQRELIKQFEKKIQDLKLNEDKTKDAFTQLKAKEKQIIEVTAELDWAKSAIKSGEVKEMLQRLPGLLMETT